MLKLVFFHHCICPSRGLIPNDNFGSGSGSYLSADFGSGSWKVKVLDPSGSGSGSGSATPFIGNEFHLYTVSARGGGGDIVQACVAKTTS